MTNSLKQINYRKKFILFIALYVLGIVLISSINIYFNVYSLFSDKQFSSRVVVNDRIAKLQWIEKMEIKPECFIMGSSNSMRFSPDSMESISGLKSFNLGMFHARSEDFWCMSNVLINDFEIQPKLVLFCLDDWSFANEPAPNDEVFKGAEKRLAYKPLLSSYLSDFSELKLIWFKFKSSVEFRHLKGSIDCFLKELKEGDFIKETPLMTDLFFEDGTRKKYGRIDVDGADLTDTCESGQFNVTAYLKEVDESWKKHPNTINGILDKSHEKFNTFETERLKLFEKTIKLLSENGSKIIINIMPNQPYFKEIIERETNYKKRLEFMISWCNYLQKKYPSILVVADNSDIRNFGGFENHFFDYMHPTSVNSSLMIESFREEIEVYAF